MRTYNEKIKLYDELFRQADKFSDSELIEGRTLKAEDDQGAAEVHTDGEFSEDTPEREVNKGLENLILTELKFAAEETAKL